jgi:hypothetical protein
VYCCRAFPQSYLTPPLPNLVFEQSRRALVGLQLTKLPQSPVDRCERGMMWQLSLRVAFLADSLRFTAIVPCFTADEVHDTQSSKCVPVHVRLTSKGPRTLRLLYVLGTAMSTNTVAAGERSGRIAGRMRTEGRLHTSRRSDS